jgi:hypothetical protein
MAAPQGNQGGGMFARYQGEQVNQIPAGYVEGMGSMGKAYAQIGAELGKTFVGMAQEGVKKENLQSTAQGLLDSYTNGDPESAMYSDSTPNHVKQFLGRSFESGGIGSMSTKDLNSFVAGEQAYNAKIDREIKLRQIAASEASVDAKGGTATERLFKSVTAGEAINKVISPGLRGGAAASVPPSAAFYSQNQKQQLEAAGKAATEPLQKEVDAYKSAYDQSRANLEVSAKTAYEADPTDPEYASEIAAVNLYESKQKASIALQTFEEAQKKQKEAGTTAQIQSLNASFSNPVGYSQAVSQREAAILKAIGAGKEVVRNQVAQVYGQETAMAINITKEDEEFAEKAARDIPDGTVLIQGPGYAWVMSGGKFVFKTATQMGTAESVMVLPPNLDYSKMYGGVTPQEFNGLPSNVQSKILDNVSKYISALNSKLQTVMSEGEISGNSLTADKFFGWSGYLNNQTQLRHVINMTAGKKTMDWSIDQIIATYQKYGTNRAFSPEARAVFRALRPAMIAAVRPMVAGGNQQSDTELRTILASMPAGEDITSLKDYDIAQYRFMKVMFGRSYNNTLSSIPNLKYEQIGAASDYTGLPSRTKVLVEDFATGSGSFAGLSPEQRMTALQAELKAKNESGSPYKDSSGQPLLINTINTSAFTAETPRTAIDNEEKKLKSEDKEKAESLRPGYNRFQNIDETLGQNNGTR